MFKSLPKGNVSRQVARLNNISFGPGAIKVPSNVVEIDLLFKIMNKDGHMGARKFWQQNLPQIQFHNPNLPIKVQRVRVEKPEDHARIPATLTIKFNDGSEQTINCKYRHSNEILEDFIDKTRASKVPVTEIPLIMIKRDGKDVPVLGNSEAENSILEGRAEAA